jgi:UDP-N-acetyl-D-glucosamine/UDP-N-acetyl-D-galactosamine dehydrogenase
MALKRISVVGSRILVLGLTFKENCPDVRNSKVVDIVRTLTRYNAQVDVYDPWIDPEEALHEYGFRPLAQAPAHGQYDAVVLAVRHSQFTALGADGVRAFGKPAHVLYDVKSVLPLGAADARL